MPERHPTILLTDSISVLREVYIRQSQLRFWQWNPITADCLVCALPAVSSLPACCVIVVCKIQKFQPILHANLANRIHEFMWHCLIRRVHAVVLREKRSHMSVFCAARSGSRATQATVALSAR